MWRREQASPTELYRICRALCKLWLFFETFWDLSNPKRFDVGRNNYLQPLIFDLLSMWELEEMECVHPHLRYQTQLWRRPCPNCNSYLMPDELLGHSRSCLSRLLYQTISCTSSATCVNRTKKAKNHRSARYIPSGPTIHLRPITPTQAGSTCIETCVTCFGLVCLFCHVPRRRAAFSIGVIVFGTERDWARKLWRETRAKIQ